MTPHRHDGEVARIIKVIERAFGSKLPPLELDAKQRIGRSRPCGAVVILGAVLAVVVMTGVFLSVSHRWYRASPPGRAENIVKQRIPVASSSPGPTPKPAEVQPRAALPASGARRRRPPVRPSVRIVLWSRQAVAAIHRRSSTRRGPIERPLSREALQRAFEEDRVRTRESNQAEARRLDDQR